MTPQGALAMTGVALLIFAFICSLSASFSIKQTPPSAVAGWVAATLGTVCLIGSAWWEAMS